MIQRRICNWTAWKNSWNSWRIFSFVVEANQRSFWQFENEKLHEFHENHQASMRFRICIFPRVKSKQGLLRDKSEVRKSEHTDNSHNQCRRKDVSTITKSKATPNTLLYWEASAILQISFSQHAYFNTLISTLNLVDFSRVKVKRILHHLVSIFLFIKHAK
jgi:hypothetical protein